MQLSRGDQRIFNKFTLLAGMFLVARYELEEDSADEVEFARKYKEYLADQFNRAPESVQQAIRTSTAPQPTRAEAPELVKKFKRSRLPLVKEWRAMMKRSKWQPKQGVPPLTDAEFEEEMKQLREAVKRFHEANPQM